MWLLALLGGPLMGGLAARQPVVATPPTGVPVRVEPVFNGEPLVLDAPQPYRTARGEQVTISTFRFYLSSVQLTYADGSRYAEPGSYHLLDADHPDSWLLPLPQAPGKALRTLAFSVGVDSATNVAGAQGGDLDPARGMYWAWHSGYVNAKLEGRSPNCHTPRREFELHIGGFQGLHRTLRRVSLPVPAGQAAAAPLVLRADVARWLAAAPALNQNSVVLTAGPAAATQADAYAQMFTWPAVAPKRSADEN